MSVKKIVSAVLAVSILGSSTISRAQNQPANEPSMVQSEVPLLSPKQLSKQMKDFRRYLNRVNRCLFTGPCTREEIAQVRRHGARLIKSLILAGSVALLYRYRAPIRGEVEVVRTKLGELAATVREAQESIKTIKEILEKVKSEETVEELTKTVKEAQETLAAVQKILKEVTDKKTVEELTNTARALTETIEVAKGVLEHGLQVTPRYEPQRMLPTGIEISPKQKSAEVVLPPIPAGKEEEERKAPVDPETGAVFGGLY